MKISDLTPPAARALVATSRSLDTSIATVVCIPCFRRPQHLRLTLESLASQRTDRRFAVVIVENDAVGRESVPVATEFLEADRFAGLCVVEPRQGNCHAINAAFETALASFPTAVHFLMIDDDEIASPDWLELMVRACETTGADVVGGPVLQNFDDEMKRGLQRHPAFRPAYDTQRPGAGDLWLRQLPDHAAGLCRACGSRLRSAIQFPGRWRHRFLRALPSGRDEIPLGRGSRHHRNRAAQPDQSGLAVCCAACASAPSIITSSARRRRRPGRGPRLLAKMFAMLPMSLVRAVRLVFTEQRRSSRCIR